MSYKKDLNTNLEDAYQFNGIDYVGDFGLDWSMATYRSLDASIGIWGEVDPKAELGYSMSPYCAMANNPISNVDPDGDFPWLAVGVAAALGGFSGGVNASNTGGSFLGGFAKGALISGGLSAATFGVGSAFGSVGGFANELGRAGAHGLLNGISNELSGGSFGSGFLSGAVSSGIGSAFPSTGIESYIGGGFSGGLSSLIGGGNFLSGFGQSVALTALNHQSHPDCPGCPKPSISYDEAPVITSTRLTKVIGSATINAAAGIGSAFTAAGNIQAGNGYWLGGNGKYYSSSWGGNQWTGGRNSVLTSSRVLKGSGTILGLPSVGYNVTQFGTYYSAGDSFNARRAFSESASAAIGAFGGVPGIGWSAGWEIGRGLSRTAIYNRVFFGPAGRDGLLSTPNR